MAAATQPKLATDSKINSHTNNKTDPGTAWKDQLARPEKDRRIKTAVSFLHLDFRQAAPCMVEG